MLQREADAWARSHGVADLWRQQGMQACSSSLTGSCPMASPCTPPVHQRLVRRQAEHAHGGHSRESDETLVAHLTRRHVRGSGFCSPYIMNIICFARCFFMSTLSKKCFMRSSASTLLSAGWVTASSQQPQHRDGAGTTSCRDHNTRHPGPLTEDVNSCSDCLLATQLLIDAGALAACCRGSSCKHTGPARGAVKHRACVVLDPKQHGVVRVLWLCVTARRIRCDLW